MYQDNKLKKIMGPLDYQTAMLEKYMAEFDKKCLALELPTGSGKTLIGLLIGEYRRRKNNDKVLYLCPTNQLVNQVVLQANEKYGLKAIAFCGKQKEYDQKSKSAFLLSREIGVTTYSSFFAQNSFFDDVDIIIMDDVHSSEEYIISNWSIKLEKDSEAFPQITELLKPFISEVDYENLVNDESTRFSSNWCNLVPTPTILDKLGEMSLILRTHLKAGESNYYAYERIKENLQECNVFLSNGSILIRPWLAPTLTVNPFSNAKQTILMSATLGKSGELERITGIGNIHRLPIVGDWDKKGLGRRFFIFPDLSLGTDCEDEVIMSLHRQAQRSVFLVPNNRVAQKLAQSFSVNSPNTKVFSAKDIEQRKDLFINSTDAIVILANRFDGVDFSDEQCRMLFIINLPKTTNVQERFLISQMGSSKLYEERIRARIVQAVGRCSRNASDYSVVCVIGNSIQNDLTKRKNLRKFAPELRAELEFGLYNSEGYSNIAEIDSQISDFLARNDTWQEAERSIVQSRNNYWDDIDKSSQIVEEKLQAAVRREVEFQYAVWKKDYKKAHEAAQDVVAKLDAPCLNGYRSYWNYMSGCIAFYLFLQGNSGYTSIGKKNLEDAHRNYVGVKWLPKLASSLFNCDLYQASDDYFFDIIEAIENNFASFTSEHKLENKIKDILHNLNSDGTAFETGYRDLGKLLGYTSESPKGSGAPDPYWIVNPIICIVSEAKLYKQRKEIPKSDVTQALGHKTWLNSHEKRLQRDAEIITVFITDAKAIEESAKIFAENIYYLNSEDFVRWSVKATNVLRTIYRSYTGEGDSEWRENTHEAFVENEITPYHFLNLIKRKKLKDL